jgi:hypothetical protein
MKKENINNYYTDEDLINFEKLKNFKEFKVNKLNNNQNKSHPVRYAVSDNRNFNKIMNIDNNESSSKKVNKTKDYTPSDFGNFKKLKQFITFNDSEPLNNKIEFSKATTEYTDKDISSFDKIIKSKGGAKNENENKNNTKIDNKKIKIIDFNKLNEREKNFKNKVGIEKIKVVYFD